MSLQEKIANLKSFNSNIRKETNSRISDFYDIKIAESKNIDPAFTRLLDDNKKYVLSGGKRLRPTLMVIGYMASGGKDINAALDAAFALEIFHSFLLIHDDIMDGDKHRYGVPNIAGIYEKRFSKSLNPEVVEHSATSMAIIAGDLNEAFTFEIISKLDITNDKKLALMDQVHSSLFFTAAGQQLDALTILSDDPPSTDKLDKINNFKTAIYTISSPLIYGVTFHNGDELLKKKFSDLGSVLGRAFQLTDDLLGVFGSSVQKGRCEASDIQEGKQTMLMHYAKELCNGEDWQQIRERLGRKDLTKNDVDIVRLILEKSGARDKVYSLAQEYLAKSQEIIESLKISPDSKELLDSFAIYCVHRDK